jgi:hypothetical protein
MLRSGPEEVLLILSAALFWRISSNCQKKNWIKLAPTQRKIRNPRNKISKLKTMKKCEDKHGGR